ncbi:MAG: hypothetical protein FWF00_03315 [Endomicrobia bacterium]|nr:hypothetical protein [Endomicrobiia bacterium]MCL2506706.1 hypothetical protein [Endomicrobiia bacterium]
MNKIKICIFACFFMLSGSIVSFAQNDTLKMMNDMIDQQVKQIQEISKNMTPEEREVFHTYLSQALKEQKAKMEPMFDELGPKEKAEYEKYWKEIFKKFGIK